MFSMILYSTVQLQYEPFCVLDRALTGIRSRSAGLNCPTGMLTIWSIFGSSEVLSKLHMTRLQMLFVVVAYSRIDRDIFNGAAQVKSEVGKQDLI